MSDRVTVIRPGLEHERAVIQAIINAAASAYRGVIPADCWHEPYMPLEKLKDEIAAGVVFWVYECDQALVGVMGIQAAGDVDLIRHAYVLPGSQRHGVGAALLTQLRTLGTRQLLVGTWAAATWAIKFYRRHGFELVTRERKTQLLERYWTIPERQIDTSVVLANPPLTPSRSISAGAPTDT